MQAATPFFGRSRELRIVDDLLERVDGQGGALVVRGEPGIGKSALMQQAASRAVAREIGERLYLSLRTVGAHLYRVFPKLGATSRGQLREALAAQHPAGPGR